VRDFGIDRNGDVPIDEFEKPGRGAEIDLEPVRRKTTTVLR
jgi:hypothetical protein